MLGLNKDQNDYNRASKVVVEMGSIVVYFMDELLERENTISFEDLSKQAVTLLSNGNVQVRVGCNSATLTKDQFKNLVELLKLYR